jgi:hypothetical protein
MTDLHDLLEREGRRWRDGFTAPDLDAMLGELTQPRRSRVRWVWPIAAAVLLLTVPLVTVLLRPNSRPGGTSSPGSRSSTAARPTPGSGIFGLVPWTGVASQDQNGRMVSVWVDVDRTPHWCMDAGLPALQAEVIEKPAQVVIQVHAYQPVYYRPQTPAPGTVLGCSLVGHLPIPVLVRLHAPLGRRSLVDGATGQAHPVQQAADLPSVTTLPTGYVEIGSTPALGQLGIEQIRQFGDLQFAASRSYRSNNDLLTLVRYQRTAPDLQVQTTTTVRGLTAQVGYRTGSGTAALCVGWSGAGFNWQLCSEAYQQSQPHTPLTAAELLTAADSLR